MKKKPKQNKTLCGSDKQEHSSLYFNNNLALRDFHCSQHQCLRIYNRHDAVQRQ